MNELELVEWARRTARAHSSLLTGIGDDMAVVALERSKLLLSSDLLLDGVHFDSKMHSPLQIGRKAVARTLSDCAAMAVQPVALLFSIALPKSLTDESVKELFESMYSTAEQFGAAVAGGDTARWDNVLAIDICVAAQPFCGVEPIHRSGARVNDILYVTGPLGGSIRGKHLSFVPRVTEAREAAEKLGVGLHAMIDISDGLALDLWRMCEASRVGAMLDESLLTPLVSQEAHKCGANDGMNALRHALSDGEDYELLLAVSPSADIGGLPLFAVGKIVPSGLTLRQSDGSAQPLEPRGFVH